ncbi:MAG: glycosyltransferase family 4 protein [Endomicrobiia bacterium]
MIFKIKQIILAIIIFIFLVLREIGKQSYLLNIRWLFLLILAFSISHFLTPFTIKYAFKYRILDIPDNNRKIHKNPTPRIAGIAVYIGFLLTLLRNLQFAKEVLGIILAGSMIFIISLLDDIYSLSALVRLLAQIIATFILISFGYKITAVPKGFPLENFLEIIITLVWFVGITNAVNFLDGIDGLVVGFGSFCSFIFLVISLLTNQKYVSYISAALMGACLGVLPYNWYKAKTFLGDCGANFIGFMLASISVVGWWAEKNPIVSLSTPVLILSIPIYDMIYITISRIKNKKIKNFKEWIEYVGKDHIHHRLLNLNFSVPSAVGIILLITFCLGLYSIILRYTQATDIIAFIILFQTTIIFLLLSIIMVSGGERNNID